MIIKNYNYNYRSKSRTGSFIVFYSCCKTVERLTNVSICKYFIQLIFSRNNFSYCRGLL
jgi:hypothetical protein